MSDQTRETPFLRFPYDVDSGVTVEVFERGEVYPVRGYDADTGEEYDLVDADGRPVTKYRAVMKSVVVPTPYDPGARGPDDFFVLSRARPEGQQDVYPRWSMPSDEELSRVFGHDANRRAYVSAFCDSLQKTLSCVETESTERFREIGKTYPRSVAMAFHGTEDMGHDSIDRVHIPADTNFAKFVSWLFNDSLPNDGDEEIDPDDVCEKCRSFRKECVRWSGSSVLLIPTVAVDVLEFILLRAFCSSVSESSQFHVCIQMSCLLVFSELLFSVTDLQALVQDSRLMRVLHDFLSPTVQFPSSHALQCFACVIPSVIALVFLDRGVSDAHKNVAPKVVASVRAVLHGWINYWKTHGCGWMAHAVTTDYIMALECIRPRLFPMLHAWSDGCDKLSTMFNAPVEEGDLPDDICIFIFNMLRDAEYRVQQCFDARAKYTAVIPLDDHRGSVSMVGLWTMSFLSFMGDLGGLKGGAPYSLLSRSISASLPRIVRMELDSLYNHGGRVSIVRFPWNLPCLHMHGGLCSRRRVDVPVATIQQEVERVVNGFSIVRWSEEDSVLLFKESLFMLNSVCTHVRAAVVYFDRITCPASFLSFIEMPSRRLLWGGYSSTVYSYANNPQRHVFMDRAEELVRYGFPMRRLFQQDGTTVLSVGSRVILGPLQRELTCAPFDFDENAEGAFEYANGSFDEPSPPFTSDDFEFGLEG